MEDKLKRQQKNRIRGRVIFGLASGYIGFHYDNWKYLIFTGLIYCIIEAIWLFRLTKKNYQYRTDLKPGESFGYGLSITFIQFFLSGLLIFLIGFLTKIILNQF